MQSTYTVGPLTAQQVDPAYLLVSAAAPTLALEEWRAFCGRMLEPAERGTGEEEVFVALNAPGHIRGLSVSAVRQHLIHGLILDISIFMVASAADERGVAMDLLAHLRALAASRGCQAIRIWRLSNDSWTRHGIDDEISRSDHGMLMQLGRESVRGHGTWVEC